MGKKGKPSPIGEKIGEWEYMVITVSELDRMVYGELSKQSAAKPSKTTPGEYIITDQDKARSQIILPKIFNPLGKKGWHLTTVNNMECYIFKRAKPYTPIEYCVMTPPELDRLGLQILENEGHLKISGFEGKLPKLEISSPQDARIQKILPLILKGLSDEKWGLMAINGPQLYFFSRPL